MKQIKIADKYLAREFLKPFLVALLAILVIMLSGYLLQLTDYIIIRNIPVLLVLRLLIYRLPEVIVQSLGLATLFATLLTLSQMVQTNEFTALRMGGINFLRLIIPLIGLALLISAVAFFLNESLVPQANREYQKIVRYDIMQRQERGIHNQLFFKDQQGRSVYIGEVRETEGELSNVMFHQLEGEKEIITALEGQFSDNILYLEQGIRYKLDEAEQLTQREEFAQLEVDIGSNLANFYQSQRRPSEMNRSELREQIELFRRGGFATRNLVLQYHINLSQALAPLIFVIIGAPLSVKSKRGKAFGIIMSIIILFIYYIWFSISRALGLNGYLSPALAAWSANIVFLVAGLILSLVEDGVFRSLCLDH